MELNVQSPRLANQRSEVLLSALARQTFNPNRHCFAWSRDKAMEMLYRRLLTLLRPYDDALGLQKVRIGGRHDGGYVMVDPGTNGIAWSLGVSPHSPWDFEMAERGFKVYQFDGSIENHPDEHPNLFFFKTFVSGKARPPEGSKNINQIFSMLNQEEEKDIILQMDIEGGEWEIFESITEDQLLHFKQMIVEFHHLTQKKRLKDFVAIFEKIQKTHQVVHLHYNNNGSVLGFKDFLVSDLFEISFLRRDDETVFVPSQAVYPTILDEKNVLYHPELYIGDFSVIAEEVDENHVPS